MEDTIKITFGGGDITKYYEKLQQQIPGSTWDGQDFNYQDGKYYMKSSLYTEYQALEVVVFSMYFDQNMIIQEDFMDKDIVVIRASKQDFTVNAEQRIVEVGDKPSQGVYLHNSSKSTEIFLPKNTHLQLASLRFSIKDFEEWTRGRLPELKNYLEKMDEVLLFQTMTLKMFTAIDKLFKVQELSFGRQGYTFVHSFELMLAFMLDIQKRAFGETPTTLSKYDYQRIMLIKQDLLDNLANPPQTIELCERYGLSAQKLRNDFKAMFGLPPYQFVLHSRFEIAYRQLAEENRSIKEVTFDLGFANPNHFNKAFKKHFGLSAGSVRRGDVSYVG